MKYVLSLFIALSAFIAGADASPDSVPDPSTSFQIAKPGYSYVFPRDHGSHDNFRTEWWYYTGHLTAADGHRYGYQLTFFRRAVDHPDVRANPSRWAIHHLYMAHAALSDLSAGRFMYEEKLSRAALGRAGAESGHLQVWIDRWTADAASTDPAAHHLSAATDRFTIDLTVREEKQPVVHGREGISRKGIGVEHASHYYSLTRLATTGTIKLDGKPISVSGTSWMDHEFGSADLGEGLIGWDWFSVQLDNRTELMVYQLRNAEGLADRASSGTLVEADGRAQPLTNSDIRVEVLDHWTSRSSGARYPSRWRLSIPSQHITLELSPLLPDQELQTKRSTQVTYWEGAVSVRGRANELPVSGQGYVELTGYSEPFRQKL